MKKQICILGVLAVTTFIPIQINAETVETVVTDIGNHVNSDGKIDGDAVIKNSASSTVNQGINGILRGENAKDWMKRTEIQFSFRNNWKPLYAIETIQPLNETQLATVFTQFRLSNNSDIGTTANLGFGYRKMNNAKTNMYGINMFYDHGFKEGHARIGTGLEYFVGINEFRANMYRGISGEKEVDRVNHIFEKAISGYDIEYGLNFPKSQWAKMYVQGFWWDYKHTDDVKGYKIATEMQLTPNISVELGYIDENHKSGDKYAKVMYNLAKRDISWTGGKKDKEKVKATTIENKRLIKVRRENEIRVERYQKDSQGNNIAPGTLAVSIQMR